jgi:hypothetical protein
MKLIAPPGSIFKMLVSNKYCETVMGKPILAIYDSPQYFLFPYSVIDQVLVHYTRQNTVMFVLKELHRRHEDMVFPYEVVPASVATRLPITYLTNSTGYVTSLGFDGINTYGDGRVRTVLSVPEGFVVMTSFSQLDIGHPITGPHPACVELRPIVTASQSVPPQEYCGYHKTWIKPSVFPSSLSIRFTAYNSAENVGFKLLFSFHRAEEEPTFVANTSLLDCSDRAQYATFKQHVHCNLDVECHGGEDEEAEECPLKSPLCPANTYRFHDFCLHLFSIARAEYPNFETTCRERGLQLVTLNPVSKHRAFRELLSHSKSLGPILIGASRILNYKVLSPYFWQFRWADNTVAYGYNVSYRCGALCRFFDHTQLHYGVFSQVDKSLFITTKSKEDGILIDKFTVACEEPVRYNNSTALEGPGVPPPFIPVPKTADERSNLHFTVCPSKHLTRDFLSCDPGSRCVDNVYRDTCWVAGKKPVPKFACTRRPVTIPYTLVCDFRDDCPDGSDEAFCVHPPCSPGQATCHSGQCIAVDKLCDVIQDCVDGSDRLWTPQLKIWLKRLSVSTVSTNSYLHRDVKESGWMGEGEGRGEGEWVNLRLDPTPPPLTPTHPHSPTLLQAPVVL